MIKSDSVKISIDNYNIIKNGNPSGSNMGSINCGHLEIVMREIGYDNIPFKKSVYLRTLMHEIIHAIDFVVFFNSEDGDETTGYHEDVIEIITVYVLKNLKSLIENPETIYDDFISYIELCEYKINRKELLFGEIINLIESNPELIEEFAEEFC